MGREYPRTHTPVSEPDTARLLLDAYQRVHGHTPDRNTAELYLALLWNENTRGRAVYNNNWGNVITTAANDFFRPVWFYQETIDKVADEKTRQRYQRLHDKMLSQPGTVPTRFRHVANPQEGARLWVATLAGSRYPQTREAARKGDANEFAHHLHFEGYIADPGTDKLGGSYARLRDDIRKAGYFNALPLPAQSEAAPTVEQFALKEGNRYRITEATFTQPDWFELEARLLAAGASNFEHWDDGQNRRWSHWGPHVYAFTTPTLVMDVVNPQPIATGATTVDVQRLASDTVPPTRRTGGGGLLVSMLLLGACAIVIAARG